MRAHICVCMKTCYYVGVCLINCESMWENVCLFIWVRAGENEQNEEVEEICFQPLSSSQSAHSHTNLFISPLDSGEGDRQRETDRQTERKTNKCVFKKRKSTEGKGRPIHSGSFKRIERIFLFKRIIKVLLRQHLSL